MVYASALTFGLLVGLASAAPTASSGAPTARVKNGTYAGVHSQQYDQDFFLGIPYAQPPVGSLRFRNPTSLNATWKDAKDASKYSPECYGYGSDQWNYAVSEDCLYLNVIRPSGYSGKKLPVAFWIHGGGFTQGGGVDQRYNMSYMVQNSVAIGKPVIGVSINYRLSTWGFLSGSPEIKASGEMNFGLRDQRLALHWVQENIQAFGGDAKKVSIFGESAGGASVGFQLTAYNGRDDKLFRGAVMQSGNPIYYNALRDPLAAAPLYKELVARTNCSTASSPLNCLRGLPAATLNTAINSTSATLPTTLAGFSPILDGDFVADYGSKQLASGRFVHVPIISGANSDEGSSFGARGINTTEQFYTYLTNATNPPLPPDYAKEILKAYPDDLKVNVIASLGDIRPSGIWGTQFRRTASYGGDATFIANRRQTCATWAAAGVPAYCYRFNAIPAGLVPQVGVTHFQEVSFVFYNILGTGYRPAATPPFQGKGQSYIDLARFMDSSWVSFFHDLDPNSWRKKKGVWDGNEGKWPKYDVKKPMDFVFDANVTSYAEPDTYRAEGMKLINQHSFDVYMR